MEKLVKTRYGMVEGFEENGILKYLGIPYAKQPAGELRWKRARECEPWDGVLSAKEYGPVAFQDDHNIDQGADECLTGNVVRPKEGDKLPVFVWIHGGGYMCGSCSDTLYHGDSFAKDGVVYVNFQYRLNVLGFFDFSTRPGCEQIESNRGLSDMIMALKWIHENIEAFGGDPGNVTVAGESAGSACVSALCTSPLAKGLFRRVVMESSTVSAPTPAHSYRQLDSAFRAAKATKEKYGVSTVEELRALPAEQIVGELSVHHHMTVDGYVLTENPYESYKKGIHNEEAQLHGFNAEEAAPFVLFNQGNMKNYMDRLKRVFGEEHAEEVFLLFPAATDKDAKQNWMEIDSVLLFTYGHYCLGRQAKANGIPSYMYFFTKENGRLGPWHSGEEVYLYGNIPERSRLYTDEDRELSRQFSSYVLNFIKTGDPNGEGLTQWYDSDGGNLMIEFGDKVQMIMAPYRELYKIFDEVQGF